MAYLKNLPKEEAKKLFVDYLKIKANYHLKRAKFYSMEQSNPNNSRETSQELQKIYTKELMHAQALRTIDYSSFGHEIIKAEAIKMQIAGFVYFQSQFAGVNHPINPKQIEQYVREANRFFDEMIEKTENSELEIYFKDCKGIMEALNGVIGWMNFQNQDPKTLEDFEYFSKDYKEFLIKNHEKFIAKLTQDYATTLDEVVC